MRTTVLALGVSFLACSSNNNSTPADAPKAIDASPDAPGSGSGSGSGSAFTITGVANGLYWDNSTSTLYFTEKVTGTGNAFAKWTDAGGVETVASLDAIGSANPGDIVKLADGSFLTPQFSSTDANNGIIQISGSTATLMLETAGTGSAGPSPAHYRSIGLALGSDGTTIYQSSFVKGSPNAGVVLMTTLSNGSAFQDVVAQSGGGNTIEKLVGLAVESDGEMLVSDQDQGIIWKVDPNGTTTSFATVTKPDLLTKLPNGDVLTGGGPALRRIAYPAGTVTTVTLPAAITQIFGVAFDKTNHRLFVDGGGTAGDVIYIVPYMPN